MTVKNLNLNWSPAIEDGLSGDCYLTEEISHHVDDLANATDAGVYVLRLSVPETTDYEAYVRLWLDQHDTIPEYLELIADAPGILYVGAAENVRDRIEEHLTAPNQSSAVAQVFPIHSIEAVHWFETPAEAFEREHGIALQKDTETDGYVHSR